MHSRKTSAYAVALGGVFAALAVCLQCLGGLIPVATYVTPMLCMILLLIVKNLSSLRIAWAWYGAVSLLSVLMAPDKEAAAVFVCLGYYPLLQPRLDAMKFSFLFKAIYFNGVILLLYWALLHIFGLASVREDLEGAGAVLLLSTLALGNVAFFALDKVLAMPKWRDIGVRR